MKTELKVSGMTCGHCVKAVEGSVGKLPGVERVLVDLSDGSVAVEYNQESVSLEQIKKAIEEQGYDVE